MKKIILIVLVLALGSATEVANADFVFDAPTNLGSTINGPYSDGVPSITADGLSIFFNSNRSGGYGDYDIWYTTRATKEDEWEQAQNLGPTVNTSAAEYGSFISPDGLCLYITSDRSGGTGSYDLWMTTRPTATDPWSPLVNLGDNVNSSSADEGTSVSHDGLVLFFASNRPGGLGGTDLWVMRRETTNDPWAEPVNLGPTVNSSDLEAVPNISPDGRRLFFMSNRSGGYGNFDAWVTMRTTTESDWSTPVNLGPAINSELFDGPSCLSADGSTFFFSSRRPGGIGDQDIWQISIEPVVDLNGDGIVNSADMCITVDHWGEDYPLCDIGPMPWGDGTVDVQDLIVLSEHLFEEVSDSTLVAHWALDETEGMFAVDSVGDNDAIVLGGIEWQPTGGQIDGALKLDGASGYAITNFALNPADGPFNIIAWINGGEPGQVVISQQATANWLAINSEGYLMTELKGAGRSAGPLLSETIITDGNWHRIGLVWNGSQRRLYVDSIIVAEDTQDGLKGSENGLNIGTGNMTQPGTYFSGLIDDIRIYNRVVNP